MERFSVAFATDEKYAKHLATSIMSLIVNNKNIGFDIYVFGSGISADLFSKIEKMVSGLGSKIYQIKLNDDMFEGFVLTHHFTKAMFYRLLIPQFLEKEKILYLDSDVVVKGSVADLFKINLENNFLAAVLNPGFDRHDALGMNIDSKYFNSGVLIINNFLWRKTGFQAKVVDFIKRKESKLIFPDQDALNAVVNGKWLELEPKYNQQSAFFEGKKNDFSCFAPDDLKNAIIEPAIIHYTGSSKPWHLCNKHTYKKEYWKYRQLTPFKSFFHDDFSILNLIKCYTPSFLKTVFKRILRRYPPCHY